MSLLKVGRAKRQWTDLPADILSTVMESLSFVDRIRIGAVCKDWLLLAQTINMVQPTDKYPWIMSYNWDHSIYILHDLLARKSYRIKQKDISEENRNKLVGAEACATSCFSLYNPFSSDLLNLPDIGFDIVKEQEQCGTCYIDPDSLNSVVLVASQSSKYDSIYIKTCRPGDITWKKSDFAVKDCNYLKGVTCADGITFYCVFHCGKVGVYDRVKDELTILVLKGAQGGIDYCYRPGDYFYLCCDSVGNLRVLNYISEMNDWSIGRFSFSDQIWIEEHCTGESIYVGPSYISVPMEKDEMPKIEVYFHDDSLPEGGWGIWRTCRAVEEHNDNYCSIRTQEQPAYEWIPQSGFLQAWIQPPYVGVRRAKDLIRRFRELDL